MRFLTTFRALLLSSLRDRRNLFFTIFFPLFTLFIFGFVFSGLYAPSSTSVGFYGMQFPPQIDGVKYVRYMDLKALEGAINKQDVSFGISLDGTALNVYLSPSNIQSNEYYNSLAKKISQSLNVESGLKPVIGVKRTEVTYADKQISYLDNLIPGILALSIFSAGVFAMTAGLAHLREKKIMKRLWTTPSEKWEFYGSFMAEKIIETFVAILILFWAANLMFHPQYTMDWFKFVVLTLSGTFGMMGIGMLILLVSPTARVASEITSVVYIVVMFFSGVYFPLEIMPPFMKNIAYALPLTYVANAMKSVSGIEPMSDIRFWSIVGIMFFGAALVLMGFSRIFKAD